MVKPAVLTPEVGRLGELTRQGPVVARYDRLFTAAIVAIGLVMVISIQAWSAPAFEHLVVFGDSLSDTGNAGRFSNGPVWVEYLADRLGLKLSPSQRGGTNFAVGGARLDPRSGPHSLRAQADAFLRMPKPSGRTLVIVYGGGNDLLAAVGHPHGPTMVDAAVSALRSMVADLIAHGATDILVPNLPDVGITPEVQARGSRAVTEARTLSSRFNAALEGALAEAAANSGVRLYRLDVWSMAERARADPAAFGFVEIAKPCNMSGQCEGYLFWDHVHPTTQAHQRLAEAALQAVSSP
jgi:phospholipase/lecithinase/hemolysin